MRDPVIRPHHDGLQLEGARPSGFRDRNTYRLEAQFVRSRSGRGQHQKQQTTGRQQIKAFHRFHGCQRIVGWDYPRQPASAGRPNAISSFDRLILWCRAAGGETATMAADQAAFTATSWLTTSLSSVATDWKFSGVMSDCGIVKSNSASMVSIKLTMSIEVRPTSTNNVAGSRSAAIAFCFRMDLTRASNLPWTSLTACISISHLSCRSRHCFARHANHDARDYNSTAALKTVNPV